MRGDGGGDKRIALVTGVAGGIGAATAQALAAEGWVVAGADVASESDPRIVELSRVVSVDYAICNVTDERAVRSWVDGVVARYGTIDALVNIAAVLLVKPLVETSWADYRETVDVNIGGTFVMCKSVIPVMQAQSRGAIVNMASIAGHVGETEHVIYGATKGAIISLCRALAWELAPYSIRVNSVSPGGVDTSMLRAGIEMEAQRRGVSSETVRAEQERAHSEGRFAAPSEIAGAVAFLASDRASFITGTDLLVDGGRAAR